jgi:hypothetical protein
VRSEKRRTRSEASRTNNEQRVKGKALAKSSSHRIRDRNFELCSIIFACLYAPLFYIQKGFHLRSIHRIAFTPPAAYSSKERSGREYLPNTTNNAVSHWTFQSVPVKRAPNAHAVNQNAEKKNRRRSLVQIIMLGEIPLLSTKETIKYSTTSLCFVRGRVRRSLHISRVASPTSYRSKGMA